MANSILNFIYMATVVLLSTTASAQDECSPTRCNSTGPEIRFPFFLKGRQPDSCGFPGFALSCSAAGATEFEVQYPIMASGSGANIVIPFRVKVEILEIDYKSQLITMNSITSLSCLPRQIPAVNSSASPFSVVSNYGYSGYTLFNCTASSNGTVSDTVNGYPVPCLNSSTGYEVIAFDSQRDISEFILSSCAKMYSVSYVPIGVFSGGERFEAGYSYIHLNWSEPICGHCEVIGKYCRPKINGTIGETECIDSPIQAVKSTSSPYFCEM
ncbi:OLC1v1027798C1 [Oldenlandia corymbosa var. corymbosa]|uniref:RING-type E3 ubiquitin transferase n=1 Tax=Oldenlandia corymbosa var. corymbosa TaxID=529605 RepID=A0AAV1CCA8_OLDCO|nr:OLC1v1027798C1 [Oldenlandia corymbosa var. corymbosa]